MMRATDRLWRAARGAFLAVGLTALVAGRTTASAPENHILDSWQVEEGLPDNRVTSLAQTADGYLWVGTYGGLVRFDGVRFIPFDLRAAGLGSERVSCLHAEPSGALWVGMEYGELARMEGGRMTVFGPAQGWERRRALGFLEAGDGAVLVSVVGGSVLRHHHGRLTTLLEPPAGEPKLEVYFSGPMNLAMEKPGAGPLWARTAQGLMIWSNGLWTARPLEGSPSPTEISALTPGRGAGLWISAAGRLLRKGADGAMTDAGRVPTRGEAGCTGMIEDSAGRVWMATWGRGLHLAAPGEPVRALGLSNGVPEFLRCVIEDTEGNVWVGTGGDGLLRLKRRVFTSYAPAPPLPAYRCNALAVNPAGGLWVGTDGHGLVRWNGEFSAPQTLGDLPPDRPVWGMAVESTGRLWLGTYWNGALAKDASGDVRFQTKDGLIHNRVYAALVARDGAVWLGTEAGVSRYDQGRFESFGVKEGLPAGAVRSLAEDAAGDLWLGISGPGRLVRRREGRFEVFPRGDGLPGSSVRCLMTDADGTVWIGTMSGLSRWRAGRFVTMSVKDGLPSGRIGSVVDDECGHLWLGTGMGVVRVARAQIDDWADGRVSRLECVQYLRGDGLASAQCAEGSPAAVRAPDGRLWFATGKGLSVVNPRELRTNTVPPPVLIEDVLVDGVPVAGGREGGGSGGTSLLVPPGRRRLEIRYAGLSYTAPERVRFRQRLDGFDAAWQDAGAQRVAFFQGLRPGRYEFRVTAANGDGVWNPEGARLAFVVQPELWQTGWFRTLGVAVLCLGAFGLYRIRIARLQQQQAAQREFSRGLIASQEAERKRIAAELHDSLGQNLLVIKNRVTLARGSGTDPHDELEEIGKLATQSLEEVREISQNLRPYQLDRLGLTKALHGLVRKVGESARVQCTADITPLDRVFPSEAETNLFRIVQEALNNVLKHSGATEARVVIEREDARVRLRIEDNGRGFEWPLKPGGDHAHGMGLGGIAERVRILGGKLDIETAPGRGTKLHIEVPAP